jgi:PTH1 family peptidyl-tRNA hydrolase
MAIPQTYMNESGRVLRPLEKKFGATSPDRLIVVHDELDLPVGVMRIKSGGGLAGHNGLKSIAAHLGTQEFVRVRIGIDRPPHGRESVVNWVLSRPSPHDREVFDSVTARAVTAIELLMSDGLDRAMTIYNAMK